MKTKFYILTPFPQKMDILGLLKVEFALPMHFNFINIANDITIFLWFVNLHGSEIAHAWFANFQPNLTLTLTSILFENLGTVLHNLEVACNITTLTALVIHCESKKNKKSYSCW